MISIKLYLVVLILALLYFIANCINLSTESKAQPLPHIESHYKIIVNSFHGCMLAYNMLCAVYVNEPLEERQCQNWFAISWPLSIQIVITEHVRFQRS